MFWQVVEGHFRQLPLSVRFPHQAYTHVLHLLRAAPNIPALTSALCENPCTVMEGARNGQVYDDVCAL